jgi:hypothetical protein
MIELNEQFSTTCAIEDIIIPNTWNIKVTLLPNPNRNKLYNKAMERIQYYIADVLDNSIFVARYNISTLSNLPLKAQVHIFPDDPWDQLVAMCLYTKFNSILEGVFEVENIVVSSHQSRGISHWYNENDGGTSSLLELFDDEDDRETVNYWFKPTAQLFLLHEGLRLMTQEWIEIDLDYTKNKSETGDIINLKDFKKPKPPRDVNDNDNTD